MNYQANGEVERFKSRLVAEGYGQQKRMDYQDTFYSISKMITVRIVVTLVISKGWFFYQINVYNAFLQSGLDEEVYMEMPEVFINQEG